MSVLAFAVLVFVSCKIQAQNQTVDIAVEPNFGQVSDLRSSTYVRTPQRLDVMEPERIQQPNDPAPKRTSEVKSPVRNFLPPQRPIGQLNIGLQAKPKNGNNTVPENLAEKITGEVPVVQASRSDEMLSDMVFSSSLNHDDLFAHQPLYFEEANLERYGRTCGPLQPAFSGVRFFATIPSLPYAMAVHNPNKTYITRWPYEAGWGAPKVKELRPLQLKPGLIQASAITGLLFVVP